MDDTKLAVAIVYYKYAKNIHLPKINKAKHISQIFFVAHVCQIFCFCQSATGACNSSLVRQTDKTHQIHGDSLAKSVAIYHPYFTSKVDKVQRVMKHSYLICKIVRKKYEHICNVNIYGYAW